MQEIIDFLQTNSALVLANPIAFSTWAILVGTGGFLLGRYVLAERIANLESRIARRDDELAELKEERSYAQEPEPAMVPIVATQASWRDDETAPIRGCSFTRTEEAVRLSQS